MWLRNFVKSLTATSTRRPTRWTLRASRLSVEALEDRWMPSFSPVVSYAAGINNPQSVITADFNGDGRLDLAVADFSSNNVSVLLGNSNGTFQPAQVTGLVTGVRSLAAGDFNSDGKLDLATANQDDVSVLLGNGIGSFGVVTSHYVNGTPASLAVGDFNADGKLDLGVTSNYEYYDEYGPITTAYANVLLGSGTGSFAAPIVSPIDYGYHNSAAVADFNGDGKLDFATVNLDYSYSGLVYVLLGPGTGAFGGVWGFGAGGPNPYSVAAGDVNADGKFDLVAADSNGTVGVLLGTGLGNFEDAQSYPAGSQLTDLAMADFNSDGKIDLVMANWNTGTVSVLLGAGGGTFKPPVSIAAGSYPGSLAVGDFNGDSRPDVATDRYYSNNVSVLLNDGIWPALDAPSISINDVTVTEGNLGTVNATFTVSLSAASGQPVSVHYATADRSATVTGGDYQADSGTLTFAPGGPLTQTVTVPVNGDRVAEYYSEYFDLLLTDPTNAFVADASGTGTILDDEPSISIDSYSSTEGNSGTTAFTFTVTLSAAYDAPVSVDYATEDYLYEDFYGATAGLDYTATSGTVTVAAGQTTKTFTVLVTGDRLVEEDEYFYVNLSNPTSAFISGNGQAFGIIVDDEPYVGIGDGGTVVEGNSGTKSMTFTVTLSAASDAPVTVTYATADYTAMSGSDYQAATGTVTFAPGETSKPVTVLVNGDRLGESVEYFYVSLTGATGAHLGNGLGRGTIQDDEPLISIGNVTMAEGKNRATTLFTFTVTLSAAYDQPVTMSYRTVNGSANDSDYLAKTGTLTFAPGETTKTITIEVKGDSKKEANEYFYLDLFGNSGNSWFGKSRGTGTILNDD
jgi:hypothetical protein